MVKRNVEDMVKEQLDATAQILKVNISHLLSEGFPVQDIFNAYAEEENIYYMALMDENDRILAWSSRFDGYLPLSEKSLQNRESWIIQSPAGKIFNMISSFSLDKNKNYSLYLGYSMDGVEQLFHHTRSSFYLMFGIMFAVGILFFFGIYRLQYHYLAQKQTADEEKNEKERYRELSAFTSSVAHEIKNPLNSLSLLFELIHKQASPEMDTDLLAGKREIQKISRIVDRFSASLKPLNLNKTRFSLDEMLREITEYFSRESGGFGPGNIDWDIPENSEITGDRELLTQAFTNLLKNALEATPSGKIFIAASEEKKQTVISVRDEGRGMSPEERKKAFDPFFSGKEKGMGIGLYLTRKIIEAHKGKVDFDTESGLGTTFHIYLPRGDHD